MDVPEAGLRAWDAFWRLDARRSGTGYGPNPVSYSEIDAFCRRTGIALRQWEIAALDEMEQARLIWLGESTKEPEESAQPMTPALFGAFFNVDDDA